MVRIAVSLLAFAFAGAAFAQSDLAKKIINDPGSPTVDGAKARLVDDATAAGGKALRVTVAKKGQNNWDSVVESTIGKPVKAGDRLVLTVEAKSVKGPDATTAASIPYVAVQQIAAPYKALFSGQVPLTSDWKLHQFEGRADKAYPAGTLKATIQIGNARQTIDLGPAVVVNMGQ